MLFLLKHCFEAILLSHGGEKTVDEFIDSIMVTFALERHWWYFANTLMVLNILEHIYKAKTLMIYCKINKSFVFNIVTQNAYYKYNTLY